MGGGGGVRWALRKLGVDKWLIRTVIALHTEASTVGETGDRLVIFLILSNISVTVAATYPILGMFLEALVLLIFKVSLNDHLHQCDQGGSFCNTVFSGPSVPMTWDQ